MSIIQGFTDYSILRKERISRLALRYYKYHSYECIIHEQESVYMYPGRPFPKSILAGVVCRNDPSYGGRNFLNIIYMQSLPERKGYATKLLFTLINKENIGAILIRPQTEQSKGFVEKIKPVMLEHDIKLSILGQNNKKLSN